ncbi:zinc ABC transporter substrate-binding protein [Klebsiella pneumoniae]
MRKPGFISLCILTTSMLFLLFTFPAKAKINVIASFSVIGDMAKNIGRDRIELRTIVGPNGDAHVYEPSPADAIAMSKADVILVNGLQLEGFISRLIEASETSAPVIETTKGANILQDPAGGHYHFYDGKAVFHAAPFDPHAWQSVGNSRIYVKNIAEAFVHKIKVIVIFIRLMPVLMMQNLRIWKIKLLRLSLRSHRKSVLSS